MSLSNDNCQLNIGDIPDVDLSHGFNYDTSSSKIKDIASALLEPIISSLESDYKNQRIKGHELAQLKAQAYASIVPQAVQTFMELLKLDPTLNPMFQLEYLKTKGELISIQSKINESCESQKLTQSKKKLIDTQELSYRVQNKVETTKVITSLWSTYYSQAKTAETPTTVSNKNKIDTILNELMQFADTPGDEAKYDPTDGNGIVKG